ncbi:MAG: SIR2 family protein [Candidatus Hermodarchaeota archaeon]
MSINPINPDPLEKTLPPLFKEGIVVFCGAGISIPPPSCSPSWWTLTEEILKAFFDRVPDDFNLPKDMILKDPDRQPEEVFETFSTVLDERLYKAFEALDVAEPNPNHFALARLAKAGILKACFTTNFDIYLEHALRAEGVDFELLVENTEYQNYYDTFMKNGAPNGKFLLCKIHGTIERPNSIVSVASAYKSAKGFSAPKAIVYEKIIEKYPCLFMGYSGWDFNHLNYRRFWERVGPKVKKILWSQRPNEGDSPDFKDIFKTCWQSFEFTEAELPKGLIDAIEAYTDKRIFVADLTMKIFENAVAHFARAEVERMKFFKQWVNEFPESHMIGLVINESQKFSTTFREFMKKTKEITQDTDAANYDIAKQMQELSKKYSAGEITGEQYSKMIFSLSLENSLGLIRNEYKPKVREMISTNKFPGITDDNNKVLTFINALIQTTRHFDLEQASSIASDYVYRQSELMKEHSQENQADMTILNYELQLKRPNNDKSKSYLAQMNEQKKRLLSGEIDYDKFQNIIQEINMKATNELMGMTFDLYDLIDKQVKATTNSKTIAELEDQTGALCITILQMGAYLLQKINKSQVYLDLLNAISQESRPEDQRDPNQVVTKEMLDEIDGLIREPFMTLFQKAEGTSKVTKQLMEIAVLSIWINIVQYLDPVGMKKFQDIWTAGGYPTRSSPKQTYDYLKNKIVPWIDDALYRLPTRFAQKLCGNLAIMGEMGNDFDLCKKATLRSLELSEGIVTEATPENIPGNLAAFYERIGDKENALKYYQISMDAIKLRYPPVWADAIIYRYTLLLNEKRKKKEALRVLGEFHPNFRGNASTVVLPARKKALELAEQVAKELGYPSALIGVNDLLR